MDEVKYFDSDMEDGEYELPEDMQPAPVSEDVGRPAEEEKKDDPLNLSSKELQARHNSFIHEENSDEENSHEEEQDEEIDSSLLPSYEILVTGDVYIPGFVKTTLVNGEQKHTFIPFDDDQKVPEVQEKITSEQILGQKFIVRLVLDVSESYLLFPGIVAETSKRNIHMLSSIKPRKRQPYADSRDEPVKSEPVVAYHFPISARKWQPQYMNSVRASYNISAIVPEESTLRATYGGGYKLMYLLSLRCMWLQCINKIVPVRVYGDGSCFSLVDSSNQSHFLEQIVRPTGCFTLLEETFNMLKTVYSQYKFDQIGMFFRITDASDTNYTYGFRMSNLAIIMLNNYSREPPGKEEYTGHVIEQQIPRTLGDKILYFFPCPNTPEVHAIITAIIDSPRAILKESFPRREFLQQINYIHGCKERTEEDPGTVPVLNDFRKLCNYDAYLQDGNFFYPAIVTDLGYINKRAGTIEKEKHQYVEIADVRDPERHILVDVGRDSKLYARRMDVGEVPSHDTDLFTDLVHVTIANKPNQCQLISVKHALELYELNIRILYPGLVLTTIVDGQFKNWCMATKFDKNDSGQIQMLSDFPDDVRKVTIFEKKPNNTWEIRRVTDGPVYKQVVFENAYFFIPIPITVKAQDREELVRLLRNGSLKVPEDVTFTREHGHFAQLHALFKNYNAYIPWRQIAIKFPKYHWISGKISERQVFFPILDSVYDRGGYNVQRFKHGYLKMQLSDDRQCVCHVVIKDKETAVTDIKIVDSLPSDCLTFSLPAAIKFNLLETGAMVYPNKKTDNPIRIVTSLNPVKIKERKSRNNVLYWTDEKNKKRKSKNNVLYWTDEKNLPKKQSDLKVRVPIMLAIERLAKIDLILRLDDVSVGIDDKDEGIDERLYAGDFAKLCKLAKNIIANIPYEKWISAELKEGYTAMSYMYVLGSIVSVSVIRPPTVTFVSKAELRIEFQNNFSLYVKNGKVSIEDVQLLTLNFDYLEEPNDYFNVPQLEARFFKLETPETNTFVREFVDSSMLRYAYPFPLLTNVQQCTKEYASRFLEDQVKIVQEACKIQDVAMRAPRAFAYLSLWYEWSQLDEKWKRDFGKDNSIDPIFHKYLSKRSTLIRERKNALANQIGGPLYRYDPDRMRLFKEPQHSVVERFMKFVLDHKDVDWIMQQFEIVSEWAQQGQAEYEAFFEPNIFKYARENDTSVENILNQLVVDFNSKYRKVLDTIQVSDVVMQDVNEAADDGELEFLKQRSYYIKQIYYERTGTPLDMAETLTNHTQAFLLGEWAKMSTETRWPYVRDALCKRPVCNPDAYNRLDDLYLTRISERLGINVDDVLSQRFGVSIGKEPYDFIKVNEHAPEKKESDPRKGTEQVFVDIPCLCVDKRTRLRHDDARFAETFGYVLLKKLYGTVETCFWTKRYQQSLFEALPPNPTHEKQIRDIVERWCT